MLIALGLCFAAPGDFERGNKLLGAGDPTAAEAAFRRALDDEPDNPDHKSQLALSLAEQGKHADALALLRETLKDHPAHAASRWYLGAVLHRTGDMRNAASALEAALPDLDASSPVWPSLHYLLADAYIALLGSEGLTPKQTDQLVASSEIYGTLAKGTPEGARMAALAAYVRKNRPSPPLPRWRVVANLEEATDAIAAQTGSALTVERGDTSPFDPTEPDGYRWFRCPEPLVCRFLLPAGWHTKEVPGPTHALFLTKQPIAPPEMRYETGISVNRISETRRRTGKTPGQFALEFAAGVVRGEGATVTRIDEDGRRVYVLRDAVQRDAGLPDLRKQYVIVADDTRDLVYLIFFETPAASWEANWAIAAPVLDLSHLGVEGRLPGDRPDPPDRPGR